MFASRSPARAETCEQTLRARRLKTPGARRSVCKSSLFRLSKNQPLRQTFYGLKEKAGSHYTSRTARRGRLAPPRRLALPAGSAKPSEDASSPGCSSTSSTETRSSSRPETPWGNGHLARCGSGRPRAARGACASRRPARDGQTARIGGRSRCPVGRGSN